MTELARRITRSATFERFIVAVIIVNAALIGLETEPRFVASLGPAIHSVNAAILGLFVAEAALKILAVWPRPQAYFGNGWNLFDFSIILLSLIPAAGEFATVARLIRILRVLRLVTTMPRLRLMVATLMRCIPGMGHVLALMGILFYVYGIAGYHLYATHDPAHWGTLGRSLLTLFQIVTLEAWADVMYKAMELQHLHWLFFVSFVLLGTFVVVNLFVAVVISSLEESHREVAEADARREAPAGHTARAELAALRSMLAEVDRRLHSLQAASPESPPSAEPDPMQKP